MPELPEVEIIKRNVEQTILHLPIINIEVLDGKIVKTPLHQLENDLVKNQIMKVERVGKYLFLKLEKNGYLMVHFGLTGRLIFLHNSIENPKHTRVLLYFSNDFKLAITSLRKFGKVQMVQDISKYIHGIKLGMDALKIELPDFDSGLRKSKMPVKSRLLDQQWVSGIGNWIADEMLYQAETHPEIPSEQLSDKQVRDLFVSMKDIMKIAIKLESNFDSFPDHYLVKDRKKKNSFCFYTGEPIIKIEVGGRGTYFSPARQKKP